jgi:hypothetical protein
MRIDSHPGSKQGLPQLSGIFQFNLVLLIGTLITGNYWSYLEIIMLNQFLYTYISAVTDLSNAHRIHASGILVKPVYFSLRNNQVQRSQAQTWHRKQV